MERNCFLCNGDIEEILNQHWKLPNINTHNIVFSICKNCGLVLQTKCLDESEMNEYYSNIATYTNPGREGKPSKRKIYAVNRHLRCVKEVVRDFPNKVFQVGCSDGYTLHEFKKNGAKTVSGIDPSRASHDIAKKLYSIDTMVGTFEECIIRGKYDLIILTHVLEHLYNPVEALLKCNQMQSEGDFILIEVPLLERQDKFPPGLLSLEHVNYFSEKTLVKLIYESGYSPEIISKSYYCHMYPVITVMAKKEKINFKITSDYLRVKQLLTTYLDREIIRWSNTERNIMQRVPQGSEIYIWGAGVHTSQLLANTNIGDKYKIIGVLDSSPTKWNIKLGNLNCYDPSSIKLSRNSIILISSYASENEIYDNLIKYRAAGIKVYKIYD